MNKYAGPTSSCFLPTISPSLLSQGKPWRLLLRSLRPQALELMSCTVTRLMSLRCLLTKSPPTARCIRQVLSHITKSPTFSHSTCSTFFASVAWSIDPIHRAAYRRCGEYAPLSKGWSCLKAHAFVPVYGAQNPNPQRRHRRNVLGLRASWSGTWNDLRRDRAPIISSSACLEECPKPVWCPQTPSVRPCPSVAIRAQEAASTQRGED
jgi:hypothetical protein